MQIIGHRGAKGLAPENTIASFNAAIRAGVDWVEFDVRATQDGKVVVMHDSNTIRVGRAWNSIQSTPYSKLKKISINSQPIPDIKQALDAIYKKAKIIIEIKSQGCAKVVAQNIEQLVKKGASYSEFMVASFNGRNLSDVYSLNKKIKLCLLHSALPYSFLKTELPLSAVGFYHRTITRRLIEKCKQKNLLVYAYTVDSPRRARTLEKLGVDALATNRPDRVRA